MAYIHGIEHITYVWLLMIRCIRNSCVQCILYDMLMLYTLYTIHDTLYTVHSTNHYSLLHTIRRLYQQHLCFTLDLTLYTFTLYTIYTFTLHTRSHGKQAYGCTPARLTFSLNGRPRLKHRLL